MSLEELTELKRLIAEIERLQVAHKILSEHYQYELIQSSKKDKALELACEHSGSKQHEDNVGLDSGCQIPCTCKNYWLEQAEGE